MKIGDAGEIYGIVNPLIIATECFGGDLSEINSISFDIIRKRPK